MRYSDRATVNEQPLLAWLLDLDVGLVESEEVPCVEGEEPASTALLCAGQDVTVIGASTGDLPLVEPGEQFSSRKKRNKPLLADDFGRVGERREHLGSCHMVLVHHRRPRPRRRPGPRLRPPPNAPVGCAARSWKCVSFRAGPLFRSACRGIRGSACDRQRAGWE